MNGRGYLNYRTITPEVRAVAVEQVNELVGNGHALTAACDVVAKHVGVHRNSVRNWVRAADEQAAADGTAIQLRRKIAALQAELDVARGIDRSLTGGKAAELA